MIHVIKKCIAALITAIIIPTFVSCSSDSPKPVASDYCYAYYVLSDDILEIYDITVYFRTHELDKLMEFHINSESPYKQNNTNKTSTYLLKCKTHGIRPLMVSTVVKKTKLYSYFEEEENQKRIFDLSCSYSFYDPDEKDSESEILDYLLASLRHNMQSFSGINLAAPNSYSSTLYEMYALEIENQANIVFRNKFF